MITTMPDKSAVHQSLHNQGVRLTEEQIVVISVQNVSKMYRIYDHPEDRLKQMLTRGRREYGHEFWALRDVSFSVQRGETVGIIGRNGSGKSTLLQIITGTLAPTAGEVQVQGRVAALLELGSGFNPEFTGRENVFLNGAILGFTREQIAQRFDEIAAFADIGEFIEQPVKLYSSGMLVRLAFAVQACVEPDILIVDEALAVGDVFFQQRCYRRIEELRRNGTTVLLVSHNMADIKQLCQRAVLLKNGEMLFQGPASDAVAQYLLQEQKERLPGKNTQVTDLSNVFDNTTTQINLPDESAFFDIAAIKQVGNGWATCTSVALVDSNDQPCRIFEQGRVARFIYEFELHQDIEVPIGGLDIENDKSVAVHGKNTLQFDYPVPQALRKGDRVRFQQDIALTIATGDYTFEIGIGTTTYDDYVHRADLSSPDLYARVVRMCHLHDIGHFTVVVQPGSSPTQLRHWGLVDLDGAGQCQRIPAK